MRTLDIQVRSKSKNLLIEYFLPAKIQSSLLHYEAKPRLWKLWDYNYIISKQDNIFIMDIKVYLTTPEEPETPIESNPILKFIRLNRIKKFKDVYNDPIIFSDKLKAKVKKLVNQN